MLPRAKRIGGGRIEGLVMLSQPQLMRIPSLATPNSRQYRATTASASTKPPPPKNGSKPPMQQDAPEDPFEKKHTLAFKSSPSTSSKGVEQEDTISQIRRAMFLPIPTTYPSLNNPQLESHVFGTNTDKTSPFAQAYHYERLEWLGDRELNQIAAEVCFVLLPAEGSNLNWLQNRFVTLQSNTFGAKIARHCNMAPKFSGTSESGVSDRFEAYIAALYLVAGREATRTFLAPYFYHQIMSTYDSLPPLTPPSSKMSAPFVPPKSIAKSSTIPASITTPLVPTTLPRLTPPTAAPAIKAPVTTSPPAAPPITPLPSVAPPLSKKPPLVEKSPDAPLRLSLADDTAYHVFVESKKLLSVRSLAIAAADLSTVLHNRAHDDHPLARRIKRVGHVLFCTLGYNLPTLSYKLEKQAAKVPIPELLRLLRQLVTLKLVQVNGTVRKNHNAWRDYVPPILTSTDIKAVVAPVVASLVSSATALPDLPPNSLVDASPTSSSSDESILSALTTSLHPETVSLEDSSALDSTNNAAIAARGDVGDAGGVPNDESILHAFTTPYESEFEEIDDPSTSRSSDITTTQLDPGDGVSDIADRNGGMNDESILRAVTVPYEPEDSEDDSSTLDEFERLVDDNGTYQDGTGSEQEQEGTELVNVDFSSPPPVLRHRAQAANSSSPDIQDSESTTSVLLSPEEGAETDSTKEINSLNGTESSDEHVHSAVLMSDNVVEVEVDKESDLIAKEEEREKEMPISNDGDADASIGVEVGMGATSTEAADLAEIYQAIDRDESTTMDTAEPFSREELDVLDSFSRSEADSLSVNAPPPPPLSASTGSESTEKMTPGGGSPEDSLMKQAANVLAAFRSPWKRR